MYLRSAMLEPIADPSDQFYLEVLRQWQRCGFARAGCQQALEEAVAKQPELADLFDVAAISHGGMPATERLLLGRYREPRAWHWYLASQHQRFAAELKAEWVAAAADAMRILLAGDDAKWVRAELSSVVEDEGVINRMLACASAPDGRWGRWPMVTTPGIYRREHASVIIRSRTTTLVTDPQALSGSWTTHGGRYPAESGLGLVDGILITHSHRDHWHLPSIFPFLTHDATTVVVPRIPHLSLLSEEDMSHSLTLAGIPVESPEWGSTLQIGDIEIDILPFYGEQPTRQTQRPFSSQVRNWGCCFRFNTEDFSAFLLADSGIDPDGSMIDVIRESVARRGPVDCLLSEVGEFPEVINYGLSHYAFSVPFEEIERAARSNTRLSMTLGPSGLVEACRVAGARYFLPYAHGFRGLGGSPSSPEAAAEERLMCAAMGTLPDTECIDWQPGDVAELNQGKFLIRSHRAQ